MTTLNTYIPADRCHALASGLGFPDRQMGAALCADISGFTPFVETMERALGAQRGAEEISGAVNRIFDALVDVVDRRHGSIIAFGGDAMTCWFDADDGRRATRCALDMQVAMATAGNVTVPGASVRSVRLKVTVACGPTRRFQVGNPCTQLLDCLAGSVVDRLAAGDKLSRPGDVLVDEGIARTLSATAQLEGWCESNDKISRFARVTELVGQTTEERWPSLSDEQMDPDLLRAWVLSPVYERLRAGQSRFLAEFRPVAVLFSAFDGLQYDSDSLAGERLDEVMRWAMEIVSRHGGYIFDLNTGDKGSHFLAVFGAPTAHGDDLRRAAAAADELSRAPGRPPGNSGLRIGVNAGRVFAGLYAGRFRSTYRITGDAVNLAARFMQAAQPGQVLLSGAAGSMLDRRFAIRALNPIDVKGRGVPVAVCELVGPAAASIRLSEPRYPLPLVGRERELMDISEAVSKAQRGDGNLLAFCADAGIGKSRLVNEAIHSAAASSFTCFAGECQPHATTTAYLPWQPIWNGLFCLTAEGSAEERRRQLEAALAVQAPDEQDLAPLLDRVLNLPMSDNDRTRSMPAMVRKGVLEQFLERCLRRRAATGPICIVIEDVHWIDSLSYDLLSTLSRAVHGLPVLIVLAYRPEPSVSRSSWLHNLREIRLGELTAPESVRLLEMLMAHVGGAATPSTRLIDFLAERAQGNPFYIEELVRYVLERGIDASKETELAALDLPPSLGSVVLGRIDRLSKSQQLTVKVASVVGRRFPFRWLLGAYRGTLSEELTVADLETIRDAGLIVADTPAPDLAYVFRHAVVRDVAYETLGFALRQDLHEYLAKFLEDSSADERPVDLLAYHYGRSANTFKEAEYCQLAGERAIPSGAYADALKSVRRASEIVAAQPSSPQRNVQELELLLLSGTILLVMRGQGSVEAKDAFDRARSLARNVPPGPSLGRTIFGLWTYYLFQGLMSSAEELAEEALSLARAGPDPGVRVMAHLAVCQTHLWTGQWRKCFEHFEHVLSLYDASNHHAYLTQYAQNPRFTATDSGFWALWALGFSERAEETVDLAITEAAALNHEFTHVIAYLCRPMLAYLRRQHEVLAATVGEFVERAQRAGNPFYIAFALALEAWAKIATNRCSHNEGLSTLLEQDAALQALGSKLIDPLLTSLLAEAYLLTGRYAEGIALVGGRYPTYIQEGRLSCLPEHLRLRAELLLAVDPTQHEEAERNLLRAIAVARDHGSPALELRCTLGLVRILPPEREAEGRQQLSKIYAFFSEGLSDPDLIEAAAFLRTARPPTVDAQGTHNGKGSMDARNLLGSWDSI